MKTDYNPILKPLAFALYMTMSAVMLNSLYTGPWSKLMRNSTYLEEDFPLLKGKSFHSWAMEAGHFYCSYVKGPLTKRMI